jgi:hypothetical protein
MTVQRPITTKSCLAVAVLLSLLLLVGQLEKLLVKAFNLVHHQSSSLRHHPNVCLGGSTNRRTATAAPFHRCDKITTITTSTTTELCMGLRDFLKARLSKRGEEQDGRKLKLPPPVHSDNADDDDDDDEEKDIYDFLVDGSDNDDGDDDDLNMNGTRSIFQDYTSEDTSAVAVETISSAATAPYSLRMGEDPDSKEINVYSLDEKESVQERINRVKAGKMSEEEKQAFLKTSLSGAASDSKSSRRLPLRPPSAERESYYGVASPFPGDPILRSIAGQKEKDESEQPPATGAQNFIMDKIGIDSQKKKRDYLDMVTNPNRFDIYRTAATARLGGGSDGRTVSVTEAAAANAAAAAANKAVGLRSSTFSVGQANKAAAEAEEANDDDESSSTDETQSDEEEEKAPPPSAASSSSTATSDEALKSSIAPLPADLGARLAAMAYQESRKQSERAAAATAAAAAAAGEISAPSTKKPEKELTTYERAAQQKLEQERMQQQMKVQDDYWTRRLAAERAARERAEAEGMNQQAQISGKNPAWQRLSQKQRGYYGGSAAQKSRAFNPDERELLSKAEHDRNEAWERNQALINRSAARKDGSVPMDAVPSSLNDVQTEQQFINDTDKIRDEQLERLRSLSSPLPSPAPRTNRINTASSPAAPAPQYRPRQSSSQANGPTGGTRRSTSAKYKVDQSVEYLKNSMNDVRRQQEASKIASGPQPSLNDVVRNREEKPSYQQLLSSLNDVQNSGRGGVTPTRGGTTGLQPLGYTKSPPQGIQPMGYTPKKDPPVVVDSVRVPPESSSPSLPPTQQQAASAPSVPVVETNRPAIRMKLPLDDVEEDEDEKAAEEGIDAHEKRKMSIADAMKRTTGGGSGKGVDQDERSKKWGIDMSKFT